MITKSNAYAHAILALLIKNLSSHAYNQLQLEPYLNGRENGYALSTLCGHKIVFSENRNSDDIVVYTGPSTRFSMGGNVPNDTTYQDRRYWPIDKITDCVETLAAEIETLIPNNE